MTMALHITTLPDTIQANAMSCHWMGSWYKSIQSWSSVSSDLLAERSISPMGGMLLLGGLTPVVERMPVVGRMVGARGVTSGLSSEVVEGTLKTLGCRGIHRSLGTVPLELTSLTFEVGLMGSV